MKILLLDVETSPNTAFVWGLRNEFIPLARLIETSQVMCYSAKWFGTEEVYFDSIYESTRRSMLRGIYGLLDEADVVVHYNGQRFDIPVLNREFILNGFTPPAPYKQVDLLKVARNQFRFASNKLDHIAQELGLGSKHETSFTLWVDCMNKDPKAWEIMKAYNVNDVILLEEAYKKFLPWIKNHPNHGVYGEHGMVCPKCGSTHSHRRGYAFTIAGKYQRYKCKDCGGWFRDANIQKNQAPKPKYANA